MNFAKRLKELRLSNGLTQQELADRLGVTKGLIGMYETGRRNPSWEMEEAIADFFNVDINYLRGVEDNSRYILTLDEYQMIQEFRNLSHESKQVILNMLELLDRRNSKQ